MDIKSIAYIGVQKNYCSFKTVSLSKVEIITYIIKRMNLMIFLKLNHIQDGPEKILPETINSFVVKSNFW